MESIQKEDTGKLNSKDLITLGIFVGIITVIYFIINMLAHLFPPPVHQWFGPSIAALVSGTIYILMCIKIKKKGIYLINGVIQGLIITIFKGQWWLIIFYLLGGILAELIFLRRKEGYNNKKNLAIGYIIFQTVSQFGHYVATYFFTDYLIDMKVSMYAGTTLPQASRSFWENFRRTMCNWK